MMKRLGDYIRPVDVRNRDLKVTDLRGINIEKKFMPSVANVIGTDLSNYKVVTKGQFACNLMHVGRDEKIPVALQRDESSIIVSPAYVVFEVVDTNILLTEYLMMWFSRSEFDRNAWFYTDGDVRGGMDREALFDMQIPIPSIEKQREIVAEYNTLQNRIETNKKLIATLEQTAQTLFESWFVDYEPFGGMIPVDWNFGKLSDIAEIKKHSFFPERNPALMVEHYSLPSFDEGRYPIFEPANEIKSNKYYVSNKSVLISKLNPYIKRVWRPYCLSAHSICSTEFVVLETIKGFGRDFLFSIIDCRLFYDFMGHQVTGCTNSHQRVSPDILLAFPMPIPTKKVHDAFCENISPIYNLIEKKVLENHCLTKMQPLLLSKMGA